MPDIEQKPFQKRQVACKVNVSDISNASFSKDDAFGGHVNLNGVNVSRVNVIAAIVYKAESESNYQSALIDDGTGKILLRSFEKNYLFSKVDIGDIMLVVGRIREFNNEKYIMPEIIKKIENTEWAAVRKAELAKRVLVESPPIESAAEVEAVAPNINEEIYSMIKSMDKGDGVFIDEIIKHSNNEEAESILNRLLENGDIFEISHGKVKVLE